MPQQNRTAEAVAEQIPRRNTKTKGEDQAVCLGLLKAVVIKSPNGMWRSLRRLATIRGQAMGGVVKTARNGEPRQWNRTRSSLKKWFIYNGLGGRA